MTISQIAQRVVQHRALAQQCAALRHGYWLNGDLAQAREFRTMCRRHTHAARSLEAVILAHAQSLMRELEAEAFIRLFEPAK